MKQLFSKILTLFIFFCLFSCSKNKDSKVTIEVINESLYNQAGVRIYEAGIHLNETDTDPFIEFSGIRDISKGGRTTYETSDLIPNHFYYFKADVSYFLDPAKPFLVKEKEDLDIEIKL